jgi:hypothetical protein
MVVGLFRCEKDIKSLNICLFRRKCDARTTRRECCYQICNISLVKNNQKSSISFRCNGTAQAAYRESFILMSYQNRVFLQSSRGNTFFNVI